MEPPGSILRSMIAGEARADVGAPRRVLVTDDDPTMRRLLADLLVRAGYRVVEAADGNDAIVRIESEPVDAVILDKEMPGMNGLDVLSYLHGRGSTIPVILITAFGGAEAAEEARHRGACRYLDKPFRVAAIVDAVHTVLDTPVR